MKAPRALLCLLLACALMPSCKRVGGPAPGTSYKIDTVAFELAGPIPPATGPVPSIHIDTNMKVSGLAGGTVESSKPYSLGIDFTDDTFSFAEAVFTDVAVTYKDGTSDPGAAALALPLRIAARPYEATNSVTGGRIVKTKLRVISGRIPGVVSRDEPFKLEVDGFFIKNDGTRIPFAIEHDYDVVTEKGTKPWGEVMQDG